MIELAAGGRAETESARQEAGGRKSAATFGVLVVALGFMTLPAASGVVILLGVIR